MIIRDVVRRLARRLGRIATCAALASPGVAILSGGLTFVGSAHSAEFVVNGSFEDNNGFNGDNSGFGWTTTQGTETSLGFDVYSHSTQVYYDGAAPPDAGEWYFHTVGLGSLGDTPAIVSQSVDVSGLTGQAFTFSAYISGFNPDSGDTAQLELVFDDGAATTHLLDGLTGGADGISNTWDLFSANGSIPADASTATINILQATVSANGNDNYVDLVSLDVVPEPGTFAIFALGSLSTLGLLRRKRN